MRGIARMSLAFVAFVLVAPQPAAAQTSVVLDPLGDASSFGGVPAPLFQDIVRVEVSKKFEVFRFVMEVADLIPARPPLEPPGVTLLEWSFRLDTDPTTCPSGFPFDPGHLGAMADAMVFVLWDGVSFTAFVIDRRPVLSGGKAVI